MNDYTTGYAIALYDLEKKNNNLQKIKENANTLLDIIKENDDFVKIMDSKQIPNKNKVKIIEKTFKDNVEKNLLNLIYILSERTKFKILEKILNKVISYINSDFEIEEGLLYTPDFISKEELVRIEDRISNNLNKQISLTNIKDSNIIIGFKAVIKDNVIEDSMESRLQSIKKQLLTKGEV